MTAISDDVNVTLYYKKSVTPCVANQTFGAASVDGTPMMWISRGCRGWFTCRTATTATPPPSRAGGGLPPGTFMCGSPFEYLSHRWCSCPPSLGADTRSSHGQQQRQQHQQHGVSAAALRRWDDDVQAQLLAAQMAHPAWRGARRCATRACAAALRGGGGGGDVGGPGVPAEAWGGALAQWRQMRRDLGPVANSVARGDDVSGGDLDGGAGSRSRSRSRSRNNSGGEQLPLPAAVLGGAVPLPKTGHLTCEARFRGRFVLYVQVYKANTLGVCGQLEALQRREEALKAQAVKLPQPLPRTRAGSGVVVFAFVRHPLERFVSGYAEVSYRAAGRGGRHGFVQDQAQYAQQAEERTWYSFAREPVGSAARAKAFVRDAAVGRLRAWLPSSSAGGKQGGVGESMDIHVLPQVAFLAPFRGRVDFVASMEDMAGGWAALRSVVLGGGNGSSAPVSSSDAAAATAAAASLWPPYDDGARWQGRQAHVRTDRHSGSPDRTAMQALLSPSVDGGGCTTPEALAVHRLLLPDFVCLGYALSEGCKAALGAHGVTCPLELPARYAPRTL